MWHRQTQQVRKLKFIGYVHTTVKDQSQGCSLLTPICLHERVSASWFRQSWWSTTYHPAQAEGLQWEDHKRNIVVVTGLSLTNCAMQPWRIQLIPAEHVKGKQGHSRGSLGLCSHSWCLLFTTLQIVSIVHENCAKSSIGVVTFALKRL